jgi:Fur family ferric uptake transcriptional regulator
MACEALFRERLHKSGLRLTPQREMVLDVLHRVKGMSTAEEIHQQVRILSSAVDISTVYRTLDLLRELDLVACIDPDGNQHRYELLGTHGPHLHLVCRSCGSVFGVELVEAGSFIGHLQGQHGFEPELGDVTIPGLCRDCRPRDTDQKEGQCTSQTGS